jgi:hypothetical protein
MAMFRILCLDGGGIKGVLTAVPTENSIRLEYCCESDDAPIHGGFAQTDLVYCHRALPITSFARGGDRGGATNSMCCEEKRRSGSPPVLSTGSFLQDSRVAPGIVKALTCPAPADQGLFAAMRLIVGAVMSSAC